GLRVQQHEAFRLQPRHLGPDVRYLEGNVVDPFAALLDGAGDRAVRRGAFEQLHLVWAYLEKGGHHPLARLFLALVSGAAQELFVQGLGLSKVLHGDADVFYADHWRKGSAAKSPAEARLSMLGGWAHRFRNDAPILLS